MTKPTNHLTCITRNVFTKDQCFYLLYHKFSIESFVLDVYKNRLGEVILIHIHNI